MGLPVTPACFTGSAHLSESVLPALGRSEHTQHPTVTLQLPSGTLTACNQSNIQAILTLWVVLHCGAAGGCC
jgi:hypothetical protein